MKKVLNYCEFIIVVSTTYIIALIITGVFKLEKLEYYSVIIQDRTSIDYKYVIMIFLLFIIGIILSKKKEDSKNN